MSLVIINGVPAKTLTSKSSTTRASRVRSLPARERVRWFLPTTTRGVTPSACRACWDVFMMGAAMLRGDRGFDHAGFGTSIQGEFKRVVMVEGIEMG